MKIAVINGPNLNRLGVREPGIYGTRTLADLERAVREACGEGATLEFFQSNHEGALIDKLGELTDRGFEGLVINPAGLTHTSVALADAVRSARIPAIEVHLSNIYQREDFRHVSVTAPACVGLIAGMGFEGYLAAVRFLLASRPRPPAES